MRQFFTAWRNLSFVIFRIRVADTRPQITVRCCGNNLCIDKCVSCRMCKEMWFEKYAVFMIHNWNRSTCRTVGSDCRECKHRLFTLDTQTFAGINCLSTAHGKHHIGFLKWRQCGKAFYCLIRAVCSVNFFSDNIQPAVRRIFTDFVKCRRKRLFTADYKHLCAVWFTDFSNLVIDLFSYRITR